MDSRFLEQYQSDCRQIEQALDQCFTEKPRYQVLYAAMRHSLLSGGKRIRPALLLAFCRLHGGTVEAALPFACAIEMIHTYSLIHDDLPCMDDDDLRRGRPTCHKVYGEAVAVLAGDALLNAAFEWMLTEGPEALPSERRLAAAKCIASAAGATGMIGGQTLDIEGNHKSIEALLEMYQMKTGALLRAAAEAGCILAGAGKTDCAAARAYALHLGLAFQIQDDRLDMEGDASILGKPIGSDAEMGKKTFYTFLGSEGCKERVAVETELAIDALADQDSPEADYLRQMAEFLSQRSK